MDIKNFCIKETTISQKECSIINHGNGGPCFLWGSFPFDGNEVNHLLECLPDNIGGKNFSIVSYQVKDWNAEFSPWSAPAAFGDEAFSGQGPSTKKWISDELIPFLDKTFEVRPASYITMGYSLAGLFSLWAFYELAPISGVISASGSLWFPDWDSYVASHKKDIPYMAYLSLGSKEEKTRNAMMKIVGERTRNQYEIMKNDSNAIHVKYEVNSGGHFADSGVRLVKGIVDILGDYK